MNAWLLHGFNVRDEGKNGIDRLIVYLEERGYRIKQFDYGHTELAGVKYLDKRLGIMLAKLVEPNDIAIGHSNGCCILHLAAQHGAPFKAMAYINPALNSNARLAPQVQRLDIWYSPSDSAVKAAKWLPFSLWGDMGRVGYTGKQDERITPYDSDKAFGRRMGHSSMLTSGDIVATTAAAVVRSVTRK